MAKVRPLRALRPRPELAAQVASVPYDVVNRDEARALAAGNARSFLHVTKPEIDLGDDIDPYDPRVYEQGPRALARLIDDGTLRRDATPCFYIYQLTMGAHTQTGFVLLASVDEYDRNVVRKHEHTRPDKERDRVRHMEALRAQSGTVFLCHRDEVTLDNLARSVTATAPQVAFTAPDGIVHRVWTLADGARLATVTRAFAGMGAIYIADGHHRSAAASIVAAQARRAGAAPEPIDGFLAVSFPASQMLIMDYNRVVRDLRGQSVEQFLAALSPCFDVVADRADATRPKQFGMFLRGRWYTLKARPGTYDPNDPVGRLDVSVLQSNLLTPLLGIDDPRRDKRIDFVGGIRGEAELERRVHEGWAVAFRLHATSIDDLFAIADAEKVMPPKSTWFEPKLRDGLFVHLLDEQEALRP